MRNEYLSSVSRLAEKLWDEANKCHPEEVLLCVRYHLLQLVIKTCMVAEEIGDEGLAALKHGASEDMTEVLNEGARRECERN